MKLGTKIASLFFFSIMSRVFAKDKPSIVSILVDNWGVIRVTTVLLALLIVTAGTAAAEIGPGRAMVSIGGSYFGGELRSTGDFIDGAAINLGLDVVHPEKPISFLVAFSWGQMTTEDAEADGAVKRSLRTWPTFIGGRLWLGPPRIKLFIGAAAGIWFSSLDQIVNGVTVSTTSGEGFGFMFPVGLSLSITRGTNLNVGYALNVLTDNTFLEDDLLHSVNVSLGFSWGN